MFKNENTKHKGSGDKATESQEQQEMSSIWQLAIQQLAVTLATPSGPSAPSLSKKQFLLSDFVPIHWHHAKVHQSFPRGPESDLLC